ncbi:ABC transporter ATP-binding protein [Mucilaginibacter sp. L3T2-6]|uniref:ATP-binding cassette domain-containing protein n=1 Tax=Mucilaginibacter sp. L3T2-6 TaxID=3062491 RepID=UPI002676C8AC|nr:ABC transporter ATP-binding protein [Mucilaginibacter sp. L3T2-6]MDO3643383.1 ABC transporter ATP-binding protein [Mucilaginibacter sp. L3T2-6]MDV6215684.1 ABC transporter ATP-binding protein [Mucilaginibacter sp. L3T2-6]
MNQILKGISTILIRGEKAKFYKLILFDFVIGVLDIAFLGVLLFVLNLYTINAAPAKASFLPQTLLNPNSLLLIGLFFMLFSVKNLFGYIGLKSQHHFFYRVASRLSKRNLLNYLSGDYGRFVHIDSSVRVRQICNQPIEFSHYILINIQQIISQGILIGCTVIAILFYHPTLFLLLFMLLLPPVVLLGWYIHKKLKDIRSSIKSANEKALQHLYESLSGYVESNVYQKNDFFTDRYSARQDQLNENLATQQTLQSLPSRLVEVFAILGFLVLVAVNKLSTGAPAIDMLTIGVFMAAAYKIIPGIVKILNSSGQIKTYKFTLTDMLATKDIAPVIKPRVTTPITEIAFESISFKHQDRTVLKNVSLSIKPGDFIGFSGDSGKGKTTLINILLGFLKADGGNICINRKRSTAEERVHYRCRISYVKQQPFFINDSILKNITLSEHDHFPDRTSQVVAFCGVDKFASQNPAGLQRIVTEGGKNLSGGQRQRIMLARALYHDFDLLILDEPFSEMDWASEMEILRKLQGIAAQGKMILFITHNKKSLNYCNKVITLNEE